MKRDQRCESLDRRWHLRHAIHEPEEQTHEGHTQSCKRGNISGCEDPNLPPNGCQAQGDGNKRQQWKPTSLSLKSMTRERQRSRDQSSLVTEAMKLGWRAVAGCHLVWEGVTHLRSLKLITYVGGSLRDPEFQGGAAHRPHPTCRSVSPNCQEALRRCECHPGRTFTERCGNRSLTHSGPQGSLLAGVCLHPQSLAPWDLIGRIWATTWRPWITPWTPATAWPAPRLLPGQDPGYCLARPDPPPPLPGSQCCKVSLSRAS